MCESARPAHRPHRRFPPTEPEHSSVAQQKIALVHLGPAGLAARLRALAAAPDLLEAAA
ncbi:hypothetical protein AQF52_0255 [Streptomyces venezuelae]|nr:hypothetical protein AQF52_0255 [Streptomyces venezuelae]CUM43931.1 hypothetical protein BN2537_16827 [Streptomyces venezuelae]